MSSFDKGCPLLVKYSTMVGQPNIFPLRSLSILSHTYAKVSLAILEQPSGSLATALAIAFNLGYFLVCKKNDTASIWFPVLALSNASLSSWS
jgi:hypothetical protein